jgi:O-antigen/teichoic acid export membrane protein
MNNKILAVPVSVAIRNVGGMIVFYWLSKSLPVDTFGAVSLGFTMIASLGGVAILSLGAGYGRYYFQISETTRGSVFISSILFGFINSLLAYISIVYLVEDVTKDIAFLISIGALAFALSDLWFLDLRMKGRFLFFSLLNTFPILIFVTLIYIKDELTIQWIMISYLSQYIPWALLAVNKIPVISKDKFLKIICKSRLKRVVIYSLSIAPGNIGYFINNSIDKILIAKYLDMNSLAIYSFTYQIPIFISYAYMLISKTVLSPYVYRHSRESLLLGKIFDNVIKWYSWIFFILFSLLLYFSGYVYDYFDSRYADGIKHLPLLMLSAYFSILSNIYVYNLNLAAAPYLDTGIELVSGVLGGGLCYLLIPKYGIEGAVWATCIGFGLRFFMHAIGAKWVGGPVPFSSVKYTLIIIGIAAFWM